MKNRMRIMVIDDDLQVLQVTRDLLEHEGFDVIVRHQGLGATSAIRASRPDLVLLDLNMPALSGESLVPLLRANEHSRSVPVLLYSANDEESLTRCVARLGVAGYIRKGAPIELLRRVRMHLPRPEMKPAHREEL